VAHTGAFLTVWELPYARNHPTFSEVTRKLNEVTGWQETSDSLRDRRAEAARENYALYDRPAARTKEEPASRRQHSSRQGQPMKTRTRVLR
jgi:hypothetical protein